MTCTISNILPFLELLLVAVALMAYTLGVVQLRGMWTLGRQFGTSMQHVATPAQIFGKRWTRRVIGARNVFDNSCLSLRFLNVSMVIVVKNHEPGGRGGCLFRERVSHGLVVPLDLFIFACIVDFYRDF